ncbi:hypothetical protein PFICI_13618 [Pestalotiopsis fici W106-1]|uniref:C2H2-type domain-containing protein n=1 Tax=Pestalotiopsis fici (strain W106-1 / CGMCC3.15140) TaxID=1229662 RepID=W3WMX7_PESFW|nr:uncharacterized protein PFICI_13618 [Pestalotiopsis fici W106-1]ETS75134.1 hypothetical protein PFICI_13618 [Pestalotiopsis fici W106-1]
MTWPTQSACQTHEREGHNYCHDCDRTFMNANNLRQHLNSRTHVGQGMSCPFCKGSFTTATGLTHHLERGSCPRATNLNRDTIFRALRSRDTGGVITNNLLEWHGDGQYSVTDRAYNYNRRAWECYLCNRLFNSSHGLNQHLNSAAHQSNLYHCPKQSCGKQFKNLAAVINHLESESCGYTRFANVQQVVPGVLSGHRMIGF